MHTDAVGNAKSWELRLPNWAKGRFQVSSRVRPIDDGWQKLDVNASWTTSALVPSGNRTRRT